MQFRFLGIECHEVCARSSLRHPANGESVEMSIAEKYASLSPEMERIWNALFASIVISVVRENLLDFISIGG